MSRSACVYPAAPFRPHSITGEALVHRFAASAGMTRLGTFRELAAQAEFNHLQVLVHWQIQGRRSGAACPPLMIDPPSAFTPRPGVPCNSPSAPWKVTSSPYPRMKLLAPSRRNLVPLWWVKPYGLAPLVQMTPPLAPDGTSSGLFLFLSCLAFTRIGSHYSRTIVQFSYWTRARAHCTERCGVE